MQWLHLFLGLGYQVTLISPSKVKQESDWGSVVLPAGVEVLPLPLNKEEEIQADLKRLAPTIVMFDRFILEEQFGPHVYKTCPDALILMETEDLHFIRRAREGLKEKYLDTVELPRDLYQTETALRETGSIQRVDYSFVVSSFEEKMLREEFQIPETKVKWLPFFYEKPIEVKEHRLKFSEKKDFCWIGNFRHAPNLDGIRWFRNEIWPLIRAKLPDARIKIYGAYPPEEVMAWNSSATKLKSGIEVKGSAVTLAEVFTSARVNLAPLRFGAGVKGKILEGFRFGVPCVSTKVGVEGLFDVSLSSKFPGIEANTVQDFADACVSLHEDEQEWKKHSLLALEKMMEVCAAAARVPEIKTLIAQLLEKKKSGLVPDWTSRILRFEGNQSRYYFGKWIEEKEKK